MSSRCYTKYEEGIISDTKATMLYNYLKENIQWEEGIRSRKGFTRLACPLDLGDDYLVDEVVIISLSALGQYNYIIDGIYLNYYQNGDMWTPNHSHRNTHQLIISLGAERDLIVRNKNYIMRNGSAIIFGSATHGVPKCQVKEGRISIAVFLTPVINLHV